MTKRFGVSIYSLNPTLATRAGIDAIGLLGATLADDLGTRNSVEATTKPLEDTLEDLVKNFPPRHPDVEIRIWPIG